MTASGIPIAADAHVDTAAAVRDALARYQNTPGALLPILHAVQDAIGHIPHEAVPQIALALNLSRAEVHGVVTYYHHFRATPPGRHLIQVCRAEACQARGADALIAHATMRLGCEMHGSSADGSYTLEPVYCLGLCASSPALAWGDQLHARVTAECFDRLVASTSKNPGTAP